MSFTLAGDRDHDARQALKDIIGGGGNYFYVELPEGTLLAHPLGPGEKLPMQFGREVRNQHSLFSNFSLFFPFSSSNAYVLMYWEDTSKQRLASAFLHKWYLFCVNIRTSHLVVNDLVVRFELVFVYLQDIDAICSCDNPSFCLIFSGVGKHSWNSRKRRLESMQIRSVWRESTGWPVQRTISKVWSNDLTLVLVKWHFHSSEIFIH